MVKELLTKIEFVVVKWYATLHLQQQRVLKLYRDGGITKSIADREIRHIYLKMKFSRNLDNCIMGLLVRVQSNCLG